MHKHTDHTNTGQRPAPRSSQPKKYFTFIEKYMPDASEEEKDIAQDNLRNFLHALINLHEAVQKREAKTKEA